MAKRVRTLLRVSSKMQLKDNDIPIQRAEVADYIKKQKDWVFDDEYIERAVSAYRNGVEDREVLLNILEDAKNKEFDILVSTTVVEVGVDVPNATVIVIENAERFGLSQLHQLRGRVGRNDLQSYCLLSSNTKSQETRARLDIMTQTNDGFVIAEKDLQIRGPGEFLGTRQSGLPDMIIADIVNDSKILELARSEAINFARVYNIEEYPLLKTSKGLNFDGDIFNS